MGEEAERILAAMLALPEDEQELIAIEAAKLARLDEALRFSLALDR